MPTPTGSSTATALIPEQVASPTAFEEVRPAVTHDDIARRAYEIFEARGQGGGCALDDWLQAERELRPEEESL
jgi:hypothetical protein